MGVLLHLRNELPSSFLLIYNTLLLPCLSYGYIMLGFMHCSYINKIFTIQKRHYLYLTNLLSYISFRNLGMLCVLPTYPLSCSCFNNIIICSLAYMYIDSSWQINITPMILVIPNLLDEFFSNSIFFLIPF